MVSQAMRTAMTWQWQQQPLEVAAALEKLKSLMQVNEIAPAEMKLFIDATRPIYAQFEGSIGKPFLDLAMQQLGSA
jgi:TRAP-type C4-dicarboxylate transport system substrate-binding protein